MTVLDAGPAPSGGWRAALDRLLASPRFHRWSTAFPLTRPIARRQTRRLFDLLAGFVYSQVLYSCVRLDLINLLHERPRQMSELSEVSNLPLDAMERLVKAAVSLDLISARSDGYYGLGLMGAALAGNPSVVAMVKHHALLYQDLSDPVGLLRGGSDAPKLSGYYPYTRAEGHDQIVVDEVAEYSRLMTESHALIAEEIIRNYAFGSHRKLLDIGGGEGRFLQTVSASYPDLQLEMFDLPPVAECARTRLGELGLGERITVTGGDFAKDALPQGADLITLNRILHDHNDPKVMDLLRSVYETLPKGGSLLISEPMAGTPGAEPIGDAYFGFYLLAMGSGRARTVDEYTVMLREVGFRKVSVIKTRMPILLRMIQAST